MDEIVYQCPECNFNADNLVELDTHMDGVLTIKKKILILFIYFKLFSSHMTKHIKYNIKLNKFI
jgi:hypothetical protein